MANRYRGEVDLKVGEKTYTIRVGMNELAEMETALQVQGLQALKERLTVLSISVLRRFATAALHKHQPKLTEMQVGELMDEVGVKAVSDALAECMMLAIQGPDAPEAAAAEGAPPSP